MPKLIVQTWPAGRKKRKRKDLVNSLVRDRRKWEVLFTSRTALC